MAAAIRTVDDVLKFVERNGIVLESARGRVPSLAAEIVGGKINGSWWAHPKSHQIYKLTMAVRDSNDILVCRLIDGRITFIHRRLWPALARVADKFDAARLASIHEEHTALGTHRAVRTAFSDWLPAETKRLATRITLRDAEEQLAAAMTRR